MPKSEGARDAEWVGILDSHVLLVTLVFDIICYQVLFEKIKYGGPQWHSTCLAITRPCFWFSAPGKKEKKKKRKKEENVCIGSNFCKLKLQIN